MIGTADFPKISHVKKRAFLAAFSRCGSLSMAAKRAKVDRRTHYNWLKDDPWYVEAFRQAVIEAGDSLQDKLTEMAFEGNVTAAIFLLKGLKPEIFRDRQAVEFQWSGDLTELSSAQLEALERSLLQRYGQAGLGAGPVVVDAESTPVETSTSIPVRRCLD
jgi:hypothetical protein